MDRKELFSAKYFDAIEELAKEGLFLFNLRTPDIPEKLLYENKGEKRIQELTELYSMQLIRIRTWERKQSGKALIYGRV